MDIGANFVGGADSPDLHTFSCNDGSTATGTLAVHGHAGTVQFGDAVSGTGRADGAVKIEGNADRVDIYAGTGAGGTVEVTGDLGRQYRSRRRWYREGFHCGGDLGGGLTIGGEAFLVDIVGDLVDASINPNAATGCELVSVTVTGEIRSATQEWIRAAGGSFYVSDSTGSRTVTATDPYVFGGTVRAEIA